LGRAKVDGRASQRTRPEADKDDGSEQRVDGIIDYHVASLESQLALQ
jgi:hypothetical protein